MRRCPCAKQNRSYIRPVNEPQGTFAGTGKV